MTTLRKYLLSASIALALSLTMANVTAMAYCDPIDEQYEYTCYYEREDPCFCYYWCECHVDQDQCDLALFRNGYFRIYEE
jgi:hypothetical protein